MLINSVPVKSKDQTIFVIDKQIYSFIFRHDEIFLHM